MEPPYSAPALPTSYRQSYWIRAEDIDETALNKMIIEIEQLADHPLSNATVLMMASDLYPEDHQIEWKGYNPKNLNDSFPPVNSCKDQAATFFAQAILNPLKDIQKSLTEAKKERRSFNVTELIKFSTMNQNAFILAKCGHTISLKALSNFVGQIYNTNEKVNIRAAKKGFVCPIPKCGAVADYAIPHSNLRKIAAKAYSLMQLVKDEAEPSGKSFKGKFPDQKTLSVQVRFESRPKVNLEPPSERTARLVKLIEEDKFEEVETYLAKNPEFLPFCKSNLETACLKKLQAETQFSKTSYTVLAFMLRNQLSPAKNDIQEFLSNGIGFIFSVSPFDGKTFLNYILNLRDPDLIAITTKSLIEYIELNLKVLQLPCANEFKKIFSFLVKNVGTQNHRQFDFTFKLAKEVINSENFPESFGNLLDYSITQIKNEGPQVNRGYHYLAISQYFDLLETLIQKAPGYEKYNSTLLLNYMNGVRKLICCGDKRLHSFGVKKLNEFPNMIQTVLKKLRILEEVVVIDLPNFSKFLQDCFLEMRNKKSLLGSKEALDLLRFANNSTYSVESASDYMKAMFQCSFVIKYDVNLQELFDLTYFYNQYETAGYETAGWIISPAFASELRNLRQHFSDLKETAESKDKP